MNPDTPISALRTGDEVRVLDTTFPTGTHAIGKVGEVVRIDRHHGLPIAVVKGDGFFVYTPRVQKVADEPTPATDEVLIDAKRAQAVAAAVQLLPDLLVEDYLKMAAFILSEPFAELVADEPVAASTETLRLVGADRDAIEVRYRGDMADGRPVAIRGRATYLTLDQVDELIGRLRAFKAAAATDVPF